MSNPCPCTAPAIRRPPTCGGCWSSISRLSSHFETFQQVYDERFAAKYGFWRPIVERSVKAFLKCGDLQEGFARVRCLDCRHEMFVAFSDPQRDELARGSQRNFQILDPLEFLAEFTRPGVPGAPIPPQGAHLIRGHRPKVGRGWYSNKARGLRRKQAEAAAAGEIVAAKSPAGASTGEAEPAPARSRASQTWAMLIKRVYEIDPLICPRCSGQMKIAAFIEPPQGDVIGKILWHYGLWCPTAARAPPANDLRVHDPDSDPDGDSASREPRELTFVDEATCRPTF